MELAAYQNYNVKLTDREYKIITKALAQVIGLKVKLSAEEIEIAKKVNEDMLTQRARQLRDQLVVAEGAIEKATQEKGADNELV